MGFSGTDTGEEGGAQGRGHRTHELISHPAPGAVARASAGVFGPAVWQAPGHRSAGRAFKPCVMLTGGTKKLIHAAINFTVDALNDGFETAHILGFLAKIDQ